MNVICNISISLGEFCCCRQHLGSFGIGGDLALQPMYTLSGGQKSRVAFAKVTFSKPHILLLDEPSNHLDLDAVNALIQVCFIRLCNKVFMTFFESFVAKFPWMCLTAFGCQQRCCQSSNQHIRTLAAQDQFWKGRTASAQVSCACLCIIGIRYADYHVQLRTCWLLRLCKHYHALYHM